MFNYFKLRLKNFCSDSLQWGSCILNIILCLCMGYFYFDSDLIVPLVYAAFFCFILLLFSFLGGVVFLFCICFIVLAECRILLLLIWQLGLLLWVFPGGFQNGNIQWWLFIFWKFFLFVSGIQSLFGICWRILLFVLFSMLLQKVLEKR